MAGMIGGSILAVYGITRRSKSGAALAAAGGLLAFNNLRQQTKATKAPAHASFAINCSPQEAYRMWRNFENLPRFMRNLESVKVNGNESEWTALGPMEKKLCWKAEIVEDRENERIVWRSLPGADIENRGSIEFRPGTAGRGTIVTVDMFYSPPAGMIGQAVSTLTGKDPSFTVREDLRKFKAILEAGEVPTTMGQPHGPRGIHGRTEQVLFRESQNQPRPQVPSSLPRSA